MENGINVRAQVRRIEENGNNERQYKRQKSDRTVTAELLETGLHIGAANKDDDSEKPSQERTNGVDGVDGVCEFLEKVEDIIRAVSPGPLKPQIGPLPPAEEVFENNIMIKHPDRESEGIPLGIHLSEHERGYRVHRVLRREFIQSKVLRVGDIIKIVGDTDVTSLPVEGVKEVFWKLDINATLTLVVLRKPEDEPDSSEETSGYEIVTVSLELQKEDTGVKFTAQVDVHTAPFMTQEPSTEKYYIAVKESGDTKYLCIEDDVPKMEQLIDRSRESDYYWRKQITIGSDFISRNLWLHESTQKTICCDLDPSQEVAFVKLSSRGFLPKGSTSEVDIRWIIREPVEGEPDTTVYYMQCSEHQGFYMLVNEDPADQGRLMYARNTNQHPKRKFYFYRVP